MNEKLIHSMAAVAIALSLMLTVLFTASGCNYLSQEHRERAGELGKDLLFAGLKLALTAGLNELSGSVSELRPEMPGLIASINATFAEPIAPEDAAAQLAAHVRASVPEQYQQMVLDQLAESAIDSEPPASSGRSYAVQFAAALNK